MDESTGNRIPDEELPDHINDYFSGIGTDVAKKIDMQKIQDPIGIPQRLDEPFKFTRTNSWDVLAKIQKVCQYKSSGLKNISTTFFKHVAGLLVDEFTYMFNRVIATGKFPIKWKTATITPIPKISNPLTCNDLRPISILPVPGRLMEQILHEQITHFLYQNCLLADEQVGQQYKHWPLYWMNYLREWTVER